MKEDAMDIPAVSVPMGRNVMAIPSMNPSLGPTLELTCLQGDGYILTIKDPMGTVAYQLKLNGAQ